MAVAGDQVAAAAGQQDVGDSVGGNAKQTVLVAGATGLVGRHVVKALLARGFKVRVLLRHPGQPERYDGMPGVETVMGDVAHYRTLEGAADGCTAVVSCLNYRWGDADGANTVDGLFKVLADGNRSLFREAVKARAKQFVLVSNMHSAQRRRDTLVFEAREEAAQAIMAVCTTAHKRVAAAAAAAAAAGGAATTANGSTPTGETATASVSGANATQGPGIDEGTKPAVAGATQQQHQAGDGGDSATTPLLSQRASQQARQAPVPWSALSSTLSTAVRPTSYTILDFAFSHEFIERQMHVVASRGPEGAWTGVGASWTGNGTEGMQRKVSPIAVADAAAKVAAVVGDEEFYNTRMEVGGPEVFTWLQVAALAFAAIGRPIRINVVPYWLFWLAWWWFSILSMLGKPEHEMRAQHYGWTQLMYRQDTVGPACGTICLKEHLEKAAKRWRARAAAAEAVAAANADVGGEAGDEDGSGMPKGGETKKDK